MLSLKHYLRLTILAWLVVAAPCYADAAARSDHDSQAMYLVNFAKFTEWPDAAFTDAAAPIVIGIAGDEVLRYTVDNVLRGKTFHGRRLKTQNVKNAKDAANVHLIFIGGLAGSRAVEFLKAVGSLPVLTVGDVDGFCAQGGMIGFLLENNRLRFEIRFDATEQAGIRVSSRMLTLAKTIHGKK